MSECDHTRAKLAVTELQHPTEPTATWHCADCHQLLTVAVDLAGEDAAVITEQDPTHPDAGGDGE